MRNMAFSMTKDQILNKTKTVTRRLGWWFLQPGDRVQAVEKTQGLKKGQKVKPLAVLEIISTRAEPLCDITQEDVLREGFSNMEAKKFIEMFCDKLEVRCDQIVNRIEFKYV